MSYLMNFIMSVTAFSVFGVACLLITVFVWIAKEMIKAKRELRENSCYWYKSSNLDDYNTGCGHSFYDASESGNPITDQFSWCPHCGGKIIEK